MPRHRKIAVIDCETDPFKRLRVPAPFVWGYYDGETYRQFPEDLNDTRDATEQFIEFLKAQDVIVYAHNGGKFDWHFVLGHFSAYEEIMIINGRIAKGNIGLAECRDSYNILPIPLAAYKKDEIDYWIMEATERRKPGNWQKISSYLRSDCVYLHELIMRFVDMFGMQLTQAGAAMAQWKKISQRPLPHTDAEFYEKFSPYYYGGRVECFRKGVIEVDFSVYDINSAYPYAMLSQHPYSEEHTHVDGFCNSADFYKVTCPSRGAFPFRGLGGSAAKGGAFGLAFPNDYEIRTFCVTGWEFEAAREAGYCTAQDVEESIVFAEHVDFSAYVMQFYEMRLRAKAEKDDATSLFAKLLMNSLYGKFAANPDRYRNYMLVPMDVIAGLPELGWSFGGELGPWGLAEAPLEDEQMRFYNVATGASITGYVRAMLWRALHASKNPLYCDTDSIAVEKPGKCIELGDALGQWKHEGAFNRAGIGGKKMYIFRSTGTDEKGARIYKTASKGVKLTNAQLWKVARGEEVSYVPDVPTFSVRQAPRFTNRRIKNTALAITGARRVNLLKRARNAHFGQLSFDFAEMCPPAESAQDMQLVLDL